ncbi:MAG: helix-turn-helix transcriptional regulator [Oscillospiraceae bacterium]|nr:helix-turn-helix transcriptional regulator [Oscillospiraceae bacterium]
MDIITAVQNRILQLAYDRRITINKMAETSGLSPSSLKSILYGNSKNPKLITIKILCDGLGMTLAEFFDAKEFNELEQYIK